MRDRNRITGAGVTAGIDFGLVLAQELFGAETAQAIQLAVEYEPAPPFNSGSPDSASESVRAGVLRASSRALAERRETVERAAARINR